MTQGMRIERMYEYSTGGELGLNFFLAETAYALVVLAFRSDCRWLEPRPGRSIQLILNNVVSIDQQLQPDAYSIAFDKFTYPMQTVNVLSMKWSS